MFITTSITFFSIKHCRTFSSKSRGNSFVKATMYCPAVYSQARWSFISILSLGRSFVHSLTFAVVIFSRVFSMLAYFSFIPLS